MKLLCAPLGFERSAVPPANLDVVIYSHRENLQQCGVGANILRQIAKRKLKPSPRAWDFLSIALSVVAADTGVRRNLSPDGWTRELELTVAVSDPAFWNSNVDLVNSALCFLTTDIWRFRFVGGGIQPIPPSIPLFPTEDCVSLLSGGLDSLIGAVDLTLRHKKRPYFVSQVANGDKDKQSSFAALIGAGLSHLQLNHVVKCPGVNERSQRSRSIIFFAYAVLVATSLNAYRQGGIIPLYVCENGFISINPPLTLSRIGSLSTRTTHPVFLNHLQTLFNAAGLRVRIQNPYQFMTKGEMLVQCEDQGFLEEHAQETTSCGRYARNGFHHCGRCVPCLIRRAAFRRWNTTDGTTYVYSDLSINDSNHAAYDDVRAAGIAIATVNANGLDALLGSILSSTIISDLTPYRETVRRGVSELEAFLEWSGVQ